ncbi:MAG: hypothetical protein QM753_17050 [Thermomicrobiales bacterium]
MSASMSSGRSALSAPRGRPGTVSRFPWIVASGQIAFTLLMAAGFAVAVAVVVISLAWRSDVTASIWEASSNAVPWYAAFMAGYTFHQVVPMLIANGKTRRDASIDAAQVIGAQAFVIALLVTLGYLVEWVVYRWQEWPLGTISGNHLFTRHTQVGVIFWESFLTMVVWSSIGAFVGAALYRHERLGWVSLIPAALILSFVGIFITTEAPLFENMIEQLLSGGVRSLAGATLAVAVAVAISGVILWSIVRDMPLRRWR